MIVNTYTVTGINPRLDIIARELYQTTVQTSDRWERILPGVWIASIDDREAIIVIETRYDDAIHVSWHISDRVTGRETGNPTGIDMPAYSLREAAKQVATLRNRLTRWLETGKQCSQ